MTNVQSFSRWHNCRIRQGNIASAPMMYVADAKEVFILGDNGELDDVEYYHDSMNVDCLNLIGVTLQGRESETSLEVQRTLEYQSTLPSSFSILMMI